MYNIVRKISWQCYKAHVLHLVVTLKVGKLQIPHDDFKKRRWCNNSLVEAYCLNLLSPYALLTHSTYVVFVSYSYVVFTLISANQIWCPGCYGNKESWILEEACTNQQEQALSWQQRTTGWVSKAHKELETDLEWKACVSAMLACEMCTGEEENASLSRPATNGTVWTWVYTVC